VAKAGIIPEPGMRIQRQVGAVDRKIVFEEQPEEFVPFARPRVRRAPKKPVMNNQKISTSAHSHSDGSERGIHRCGEPGYLSPIFGLESVDGPVVVFDFRGSEQLVAVSDDRG
jgi:hypothetical protein